MSILGIPVGIFGAGVPPASTLAGLNPQGNSQGSLSTDKGVISWSRSSNGDIHASGGGQTLTVTGQFQNDGSGQSQTQFAETGQSPYLTIKVTGNAAPAQATCTLTAGSSTLTLTVAGINAAVTSGTATVSGVWNGANIHWIGPADLTSNPLKTHPNIGWPAGAFSTQLGQAAFFSPLGREMGQVLIKPQQAISTSALRVVERNAVGVFAHAVAWCVGGVAGGAFLGPETAGTSMLVGCVGGATGSLLDSLVTWAEDSPADIIPTIPTVEPPPLPVTPGPTTTVVQDSPPPPAGGGGPGSTGYIDPDGNSGGGSDDGGGGGGNGNPLDKKTDQTTLKKS